MRGKTILRLYVVLVLVGISVARATSSCAVEFNFTYNSAVSTPPGDLNDNNGLITDLDGSVLTEMMEVAGDMWGDILLDDWTINIEVRWQVPQDGMGNPLPGASAQFRRFSNHPGNLDKMGNPIEAAEQNSRVVWAFIRFNPNRKWWVDPTPEDHSEFTMAQTLYRDLSAAQQTSYNAEPDLPPNLLDVGFGGAPNATAPAAMQVAFGAGTTMRSRDLLTYALHELGHSIGVGGTQAATMEYGIAVDGMGNPIGGQNDGDYDIDPILAGGADFSVNSASLTDGHITNQPQGAGGASEAVLMNTNNLCCARRLPSAIDVMAAAATANWTDIRLQRTDFLIGSDWNTSGNWEGNRVPELTVDSFVRHGGSVSLSADGESENLLIDEQSSVTTSIHTLHVFDTTTIGGTTGGTSQLTVSPIGVLQTNVLEINDEGRTRVDFGGLVDASTLNVNDGGELQLAGTMTGAAVVDGIIAHVNDGGLIRVTGDAQIDDQLAIHQGGTVDVQDPSVELRLNGITGLDGGTISGAGTVRQNGTVFVTDDTTIDVDTYDLDGQFGSTSLTVNAGNTLSINSANIDTTAANDFDGILNVNGGTLHMQNDWRLDSVLNLTQDNSVAALVGPGRITVASTGTVNVSGAGRIDSDLTLVGELFVASIADLNGNTIIDSAATLETNNPDDIIDLGGTTVIGGGTYLGGGILRFSGDIQVIGNTAMGMGQADLDGIDPSGSISVATGVNFAVNSNTIDPADDTFSDTMNLRGSFSTIVPLAVDGTINMIQQGGGLTPQLNGATGLTILPGGDVSTEGNAEINRDTTVEGNLNVGAGVAQINAASILFESTANVSVAASGTLALNGPTTYEGGFHGGLGLIQFNGMTNINADTTINAARVDLDGAAENTSLNLNDSQLTLNVDLVETNSINYDGLANIVGENARLTVNLSSPTLGWRLMSGGQLNFSNPAPQAPLVTMLAGSPLNADGVINAVGPIILAADVAVRTLLNANTTVTNVHFGGPSRSTVHANPMATVVGLGQITVDNGTTLNLEDQSTVAVDTTNAGRLELGFQASEVSVDYTVPATATVRGFFAQTLPGEFAVDLAGTIQATQYDLLQVIGRARLSGTVEATFIDDFVPNIGDVFTILTATSIVEGEFTTVEAFDENGVLGFVLTDLYTPNAAMLRVDDVFLIGDYNDDGVVNAADYVVWQDNLGLAVVLPGDATPGTVDQSDYDAWANNFGATFPGPGAGATVPEPSAGMLVLLAAIIVMSLINRCRHACSILR